MDDVGPTLERRKKPIATTADRASANSRRSTKGCRQDEKRPDLRRTAVVYSCFGTGPAPSALDGGEDAKLPGASRSGCSAQGGGRRKEQSRGQARYSSDGFPSKLEENFL